MESRVLQRDPKSDRGARAVRRKAVYPLEGACGIPGFLLYIETTENLKYGEENFYSWDGDFSGFWGRTGEGGLIFFGATILSRVVPGVVPISVPSILSLLNAVMRIFF